MTTPLRVLGTSWCSDCTRSKRFLDEHAVAYEWTDIEENEAAAREVEALNDGRRVVPTILFPDGTLLVEPSDAALGLALGLAL